ncbi:MAG: hypothetical protein M1358_01440 [Chloroflexi bacterium]|nr:hypothetical protein [Chloroflexota bacterium]
MNALRRHDNALASFSGQRTQRAALVCLVPAPAANGAWFEKLWKGVSSVRFPVRAVCVVLVMAVAAAIVTWKDVPRAEAEPSGFAAVSGASLVDTNGKPSFMVGTNYEGFPDRSWKLWEDGLFDAGLIDRDMAKAKRAGVRVLRLFVQRPLVADIAAGKWGKLDTVVNLARNNGLLLSITFFDYAEIELAKVAQTDRLIAQRYAKEPAIFSYGIKNEPHYQDVAAAKYPAGVTVPLMSDVLIKQYGERASEPAVAAWRQTDEGKAQIPSRFSSKEAYLYINNYRIYREFLDAAGKWVKDRNYDLSTLDYLDSPDSARWAPLLQAMDGTLGTWIAVQRDAIRGVDSGHLITVGYSDMILAKMGSNKVLDYQAIHRYPGGSLRELGLFFDVMRNLKTTHAGKPVVLEEFGYSNAGLSSAASSIYETALYLFLWKEGFAGGLKWMLNDLASGWDAQQMNFGMYTPDEKAKPVVSAMNALATYFRSPSAPGDLRLDADPDSGVRYAYSAPDALFVAGKSFGDSRLRYQSDGPAQVFLSWKSSSTVLVQSTANMPVQVNPSAVLGDGSVGDGFTLERVDGEVRTPQQMSVSAGWGSFSVVAGRQYALRLPPRAVDAKIQIVWPIGNKPVSQATTANIGAYLFGRGGTKSICADPSLKVELWRALNNDVEDLVGTGQMVLKDTGSGSVPSWQFNDVDVSAAKDPMNKYYFSLNVPGMPLTSSNTWSHGADARTYFPRQDVPAGVKTSPPAQVDAKVEIVWPLGNAPVSKATRANVGALLFEKGTLQSVPPTWNPVVRLWRSVNNNPAEFVATGRVETKTAGGATHPVWNFDNVDVGAATDPNNKLYFRLTVDGVPSRSNIWSHAVDARTYFPKQDSPVPPDGC